MATEADIERMQKRVLETLQIHDDADVDAPTSPFDAAQSGEGKDSGASRLEEATVKQPASETIKCVDETHVMDPSTRSSSFDEFDQTGESEASGQRRESESVGQVFESKSADQAQASSDETASHTRAHTTARFSNLRHTPHGHSTGVRPPLPPGVVDAESTRTIEDIDLTRDHMVAALLAIFLGAFGVHKFYLGYPDEGFIMMAVTLVGSVLTLGLSALVMFVVGVVEGIGYLSKSQTEFDDMYVMHVRPWF